MKKIVLIACVILLSGCTSNNYYSDNYDDYSDYDSDSKLEELKEQQEEYQSQADYLRYNCTSDCGGHDAGYEWAEENGIDDPYDCEGKSDSFIEGCEAYANEQQAEYLQDEIDGYEDNY